MLGSYMWGFNMGYIKSILHEEYERLKALSDKYSAEIKALPRGSVSVKKRNKNEYLYLASRHKGKVRFEYIGPMVSEKAMAIRKKIEIRKQYENKMKQVRKDLREIEKAISGKKI